MIVKAKHIGNQNDLINDMCYGLSLKVIPKMKNSYAYDPADELPTITVELNGGEFPNYERLKFTYHDISDFFDHWTVLSIHQVDKSLGEMIIGDMYKNLRDNKLKTLLP
jgi:hypothetical protein